MSREIKFRAWDGSEMLTMPLDGFYGLSRFFGFISATSDVMQFTGLQDKNGVDIYESDILIAPNPHYQPHNGSSFASVGAVSFENGLWDSQGVWIGYWQPHEIEVLGNIHENPELLEEK